MGNHVETLRWNGSAIEMIDQRILPHRIEYIACDSAQSVAKAIRDMVVRGAPAIGVAAAYGVALEAILRKNEASNVFSTSLEEGFKALGGQSTDCRQSLLGVGQDEKTVGNPSG